MGTSQLSSTYWLLAKLCGAKVTFSMKVFPVVSPGKEKEAARSRPRQLCERAVTWCHRRTSPESRASECRGRDTRRIRASTEVVCGYRCRAKAIIPDRTSRSKFKNNNNTTATTRVVGSCKLTAKGLLSRSSLSFRRRHPASSWAERQEATWVSKGDRAPPSPAACSRLRMVTFC